MSAAKSTPAAMNLRDDLLVVLSTHCDAVSAEEMVAICARLTGELLAQFDTGRMNDVQLTNLTVGNMQLGYADAVDHCAAQAQGRPN